MKLNEWRFFILAFLLGVSVWAFAGKIDLRDAVNLKLHNNIQLLFVQHAPLATITKKNNTINDLVLRLYSVPNSVIYFANQPNHVAGRVSLSNFIHVWRHHHINPNVEVDAISVDQKREFNAVFTFSHPVYFPRVGVLQYTLHFWSNDEVLTPHMHQKRIRLKDVSLFIDHFSQWPP